MNKTQFKKLLEELNNDLTVAVNDLKKGVGVNNFIKHFEAINKIDDIDMNEFKKYL